MVASLALPSVVSLPASSKDVKVRMSWAVKLAELCSSQVLLSRCSAPTTCVVGWVGPSFRATI